MRCKVKVTVVDATDFSFVLTRRGWGMLHNVLRALSWAVEAIGLSARPCLYGFQFILNPCIVFSVFCAFRGSVIPWIPRLPRNLKYSS